MALQAGAVLSVSQGVVIAPTGNLTGDGSIDANVTNTGTITSPTNLSISGQLTNHGVISGSGRINAAINNAADGQLRLSSGQRLLLSSGAGNIANSGRFDVLGGGLEVDGQLHNAGQIDVIAG